MHLSQQQHNNPASYEYTTVVSCQWEPRLCTAYTCVRIRQASNCVIQLSLL